ncbi:MAG: hypothetical protein JO172_12330 [Hyphomicrobiales bacterium]|nr:hypothetical protein [Hyphomicrobiales bacterium]
MIVPPLLIPAAVPPPVTLLKVPTAIPKALLVGEVALIVPLLVIPAEVLTTQDLAAAMDMDAKGKVPTWSSSRDHASIRNPTSNLTFASNVDTGSGRGIVDRSIIGDPAGDRGAINHNLRDRLADGIGYCTGVSVIGYVDISGLGRPAEKKRREACRG